MASTTKPKGTPQRAAMTSQSPNQPKGPVKADPGTDDPTSAGEQVGYDDNAREEQEPESNDIESESDLSVDGPAGQPPIDNEHVESGAEPFYGDTEGPVPMQGPAVAAAANSPVAPGSSVDPVTGRPIDPATGRAVGTDLQGRIIDPKTGKPEEKTETEKRSSRDRVKDIETRWQKDFEDIIIDIHDHIFGTSPPHEETTAKRKDAEDKNVDHVSV